MTRILPPAPITAIALAAIALAAISIAWPAGAGLQPPAAHAVGETCSPAKPYAAGTAVLNLATSSGNRSYRLHVPPSYTGVTPVPVVLAWHGAGSNALEQEVYSAFSAKSDAEGFLVAYPDGLVTGIPFTHFNAWQLPVPPEPDDVAFASSLIAAVATQLCVDQSRVYSTGMSNGAMMSTRLACSLSGRIAAIAPVAGAYYPPDATNINPSETCPDTAPVPFIAFHGTADATVPYNGGVGSGSSGVNYRLPLDDNTPAEDVLSDWAAHNGCTGPRTETQIDTEIRFIEYASCTNNALAQLYAVDGGGHTWPGSFFVPGLGYVTAQINATNLMWSFFTNYSLPDADLDLIPDAVDICPADADFPQTNTDRNFIDNPAPLTQDDATRARSDNPGDACDTDDDNDGLLDADELALPGAACPAATAALDPLNPDTDGDAVTDAAECAIGTDPADNAAKPTSDQCRVLAGAAALSTDTDNDRILDRVEACGYNTSPTTVDSDGDGRNDGCEVASLNTLAPVNSGDQLLLSQAVIADLTGPFISNADLDKSGANNSGDQLLMAQIITAAIC